MKNTLNQVDRFKEVMGNYPTGVTVVTTSDEDGVPYGLTVNSFASVSLDPLLILWSIDHRVSSLETFKRTEKFAVHVLAGEQQDICKLFASKEVDRFNNCDWNVSDLDLPIISGAFATLQCKMFKQVEAGDHTIIIGEVLDIDIKNKEPMLYHRRNFGSIPENFYK